MCFLFGTNRPGTHVWLSATNRHDQRFAKRVTNRIVSRSADPPVVERNMLSSEFAPLSALWGDNPPSEPRVGGVLLGDTPPQSLTAVSQTHTVYSSFADVQSYKLNDEPIYTPLYKPFVR